MKYFICALALSFGVAHAEITPDMLNQTHDGANIQAGTYFNTAGAETKFINSAGTGITLDAGQNIRGIESANGLVTGNGGNIHIQAPDQVVRLNGNIDVRDFLPNGGKNTGTLTLYGPSNDVNPITHGGNVTVDAAYLFQNGNIYAGGLNGGNVTMNVGGMTMGPTSRIDASGQNFISQTFREFSGAGGNVTVNSTGDVDINKGAFITTNGNNAANAGNGVTYFGNNIVITGHNVDVNGTLLAGQLKNRDMAIWATENGTIHISSTGQDGDVNIGKDAIIQTDGGAIKVDSQRDINQNGLILATGNSAFNGSSDDTPWNEGVQGGKGGTISLTAVNLINNAGRLQADGHGSSGGEGHIEMGPGFTGGSGGTIIVTAPNINNDGVIRAMGGSASLWHPHQDEYPETLGAGGKGGDVTFNGSTPTGSGSVVTFGGNGSTIGALGTITAPDPVSSPNTLMGVWKKLP